MDIGLVGSTHGRLDEFVARKDPELDPAQPLKIVDREHSSASDESDDLQSRPTAADLLPRYAAVR